jgi:hypothetical protein
MSDEGNSFYTQRLAR